MGCIASGHNFYHMHEGNFLARKPRHFFPSQMSLQTLQMHFNMHSRAAANRRWHPLKPKQCRVSKQPTLAPCLRLTQRPRRMLVVDACAHQIPPLDVSRQHSGSGKAARPFPAALPELLWLLTRSRESSPGSDPTRTRSPR